MSPHHPHRPDDELLTGRAAARILGIHENTVRNWADAGILPVAAVMPGTRYRRYYPADVEALKQKMAVQNGPRVLTAEQHLGARQIAEQLRLAAQGCPWLTVGVAGSAPGGACFSIERDNHQYMVWVLPQLDGAV